MRKSILFILLIPLCSFALVKRPYSEGFEWVAEKCKNVQCVDENLKIIDTQISRLIAKRLAYVKRGAELKARNVRLKNKPIPIEESLPGIQGMAKEQGYNPDAASSIFKEINKQSSEYEQKILDKHK